MTWGWEDGVWNQILLNPLLYVKNFQRKQVLLSYSAKIQDEMSTNI